jgi:hypothetical protein
MTPTSDLEPKRGKAYYTLAVKDGKDYYVNYTGNTFDEEVVYYEEVLLEKKVVKIPPNLDLYIYDYEREEVEIGHEFDFNNNVYSTIDLNTSMYTNISKDDIKGIINNKHQLIDSDFLEAPSGVIREERNEYYIAVKTPTLDEFAREGKKYYKKKAETVFSEVNTKDAEGNLIEDFSVSGLYENKFERANPTAGILEKTYYIKSIPTYYYYKKENAKKNYIRVKYPQFIDDEDIYTAGNYFLYSISVSLPLYKENFVYE